MNTPKSTQQSDDTFRHALQKKYLDDMNTSYSIWKLERRIFWERYWTWGILITAFVVMLEVILLSLFHFDMSPDEFNSIVLRANPLLTPATSAIMAIFSGWLAKALFKTKVWNIKCTIAAIISGFLAATVRIFQIFLVYLTMFVSLFPFLYFLEAYK